MFAVLLITAAVAVPLPYVGVNLAGAEFGAAIPGTYGKDYIYPTQAEVDYFKSKGMNLLRIPFRWERLQHSLMSDFNASEFQRLNDFVQYATGAGVNVLLDPHNYARYNGQVIGASSVTAQHFADFWSRLAAKFLCNSMVFFGLMNEPNTMSTETWFNDAQTAINAIRQTGAKNLIIVPGNAWTGASSWTQNWYGTSNSIVSLNITDPINNFVFDIHQYLDSDGSGSKPACVSSTIGVERLSTFYQWANTNGKKALLSEFAGSTQQTCLDAVNNMLTYIEGKPDVFVGFTWWSAGPWWGSYMFSIEPTSSGQDAGQMDTLRPHLH